jgi:hypothetical protein
MEDLMRNIYGIGVAVLVAGAGSAVGCAGSGGGAADHGGDGQDAGSGTSTGDARSAEASLADRNPRSETSASDVQASVTVQGIVTGGSGINITDRAVSVLDGAGQLQVVLTDTSGKFTVPDVVTPYDLLVTGPSTSLPIAYLHLTAATLQLYGDELSSTTPPPTESSASIAFSVALPACGGDCTLFVADSLNGEEAGNYGSVIVPESTSYPAEVSFQWHGSSSASAEVNVLVANASLTSFWYSTFSETLLPSDAATWGVVTPSALATADTLTLTSTEDGSFPGWATTSLGVALYFPGGGSTELADLQTPTLSAGIPDILGATLSVSASTSLSVDGGAATVASIAEKTSLALTTASESLNLYPPASWITPSVGGGGSIPFRSTLQWTPSASAPLGLNLVQIGTPTGSCLVFSSTSEVSLTSLLKLGVPLSPGAYTLVLEQLGPEPSLDSLVSGGALMKLVDGPFSASWLQYSQVEGTLSP